VHTIGRTGVCHWTVSEHKSIRALQGCQQLVRIVAMGSSRKIRDTIAEQMCMCQAYLDVHFIYTLPVLVTSRHSRESGNPGDKSHGDWMPAFVCACSMAVAPWMSRQHDCLRHLPSMVGGAYGGRRHSTPYYVGLQEALAIAAPVPCHVSGPCALDPVRATIALIPLRREVQGQGTRKQRSAPEAHSGRCCSGAAPGC
jgi:hypothetical protein